MALYGTVVNGVVVIDGPPLPEGTRVWVGLEEDDYPLPPHEETHEQFLQSLRDSIADAEAGKPGLTVDEAMAAVDAELAKFANTPSHR